MADIVGEIIRLGLYDTKPVIPLMTLGAGTHTQRLLCQGNSLLSTLVVESLDVGASITVRYWDYGAGDAIGERYDLAAHTTITAPAIIPPDRLLVTRVHDKPTIEVEITGGSVRFGVYLTVVASFASELDSALKKDGETADLAQDLGMPMMCYDSANNEFRFIRCDNGVLPVSVTSVTKRETGSAMVVYGASSTLVTYSPAVDERVNQIIMGGDGSGKFTVKLDNGVDPVETWGIVRNAWNERQVIMPFGGKKLTPSDTITVEVENVSVAQSGTCEYEAFLYLG